MFNIVGDGQRWARLREVERRLRGHGQQYHVFYRSQVGVCGRAVPRLPSLRPRERRPGGRHRCPIRLRRRVIVMPNLSMTGSFDYFLPGARCHLCRP